MRQGDAVANTATQGAPVSIPAAGGHIAVKRENGASAAAAVVVAPGETYGESTATTSLKSPRLEGSETPSGESSANLGDDNAAGTPSVNASSVYGTPNFKGASISSLRSTSTYQPPPAPPTHTSSHTRPASTFSGIPRYNGTPRVAPFSRTLPKGGLNRQRQETMEGTAVDAPKPVSTSYSDDEKVVKEPTIADKHNNVVLVCPDCRNPTPNIIEEFAQGDLVCGDCGLVLGNRIIDTRSEWRTFANDEGEDPSRVGSAISELSPDSGLDTAIAYGGDGGSGVARELNRIHGRNTAVKHERNLLQGYRDIQTICDSVDMKRVVTDTAKSLYKQVEDNKYARGKSHECIIAVCIYMACRLERDARTVKEICKMTGVEKRDLGRTYRELSCNLRLKNVATSPEELTSRFCSYMSLSNVAQAKATMLNRNVRERGTLAGKSPVSIAAACIYMISHLIGQPRESSAISESVGVSEVTIRNAYKLLYADREHLLDEEILSGCRENAMKELPLS